MGRLTNQIIGTARGKIGNIVLKAKKSGESIAYPYNPNRKKTESEKAIAHNNRFRTINKFASAVNDSDFLKGIWSIQKKLKGKNAYNKIHSFNYPYSNPDFMSAYATIVPNGIMCKITEFKSSDDKIKVTIVPEKELIDVLNPPFIAICMIYLNTPFSKRKGRKVLEHDVYITLEEELESPDFIAGKPFVIKYREYKNEFKIIDDYRRIRVFFSLIFNSKYGNRVWTKSSSYLYKGAELDDEHAELIKQNKEETARKENAPSEPYYKLSRR